MEPQSLNHWQQLAQDFLKTAKHPLIVVLGPTAGGKTDFSIQLAEQLGGSRSIEIVNADSRQLYKYLDIGTAKITPDEMHDIPHHLLSVLDPKDPVTIAWYKREAMKTIDEIIDRKKIPMLVGGSMLYISSIIDGLEPSDRSDPRIRSRLEKEYDVDQGVSLHKRLAEIDPESAASIPVQNKIYLMRALEIFEVTGKTKSDQKRTSDCPYDLLIFGIHREREDLAQRIDERTKKLLKSGWIEEVRSLIDRGYSEADPGMQSHGYREIMTFLKKGSDRSALAHEISAKTRQYAKRQMTWWRGDSRINWIQV